MKWKENEVEREKRKRIEKKITESNNNSTRDIIIIIIAIANEEEQVHSWITFESSANTMPFSLSRSFWFHIWCGWSLCLVEYIFLCFILLSWFLVYIVVMLFFFSLTRAQWPERSVSPSLYEAVIHSPIDIISIWNCIWF